MKEVTGEFSMTVITILSVVVIATLIGWLGPRITNYIKSNWQNIATCPDGTTLQDDGSCK